MAYQVMKSPLADICQCKKHDCYIKRVDSFKIAPPNIFNVNVYELSKSGFSYLGPDDRCICFYCKVIISEWNLVDCPYAEHLKHSEYCNHILKLISKKKKLNITKKKQVYERVDISSLV